MDEGQKYSPLGKISLSLSIIGVAGAFFGSWILHILGIGTSSIEQILLIVIVGILGFLAIPLGAFAYWLKDKDQLGLIALILGLVSVLFNGFLLILAAVMSTGY